MMASNILSRFLPSASDEPLPFEDAGSPGSHQRNNHDNPAGMDIDDVNLHEHFEEQDLENLLADGADSQMTTESTAFLPQRNDRAPSGQRGPGIVGWRQPAQTLQAHLDDDDDVPESLMLEGRRDDHVPTSRTPPSNGLPPPVAGPSTRRTQAQWEATRREQRLHDDIPNVGRAPGWSVNRNGPLMMDPKEKALWMWANVQDLDAFFHEVYQYYIGHGVWSIVLCKLIRLIQTAFVVGFTTFMTYCINYSKIPGSRTSSEFLVPKCTSRIHGLWYFLLWLFVMFWLWSAVSLVREIPRLQRMHNFFRYALDIPDRDIQTVEWQHVVTRLMALRDANLATAENLDPETRKVLHDKSRIKMDAHDIANRIMRRDNYLIALFNKEILDVTISLPFGFERQIFSETTEWHVNLAIMDFVFNEKGRVNPEFLKEKNRRHLVNSLRRRLFIVGLLSCICAPFTVVYSLVLHIFRYFSEYRNDPSQLGARDFTPLAQWKFREFNELPHLFSQRKSLALPIADCYLSQFPKDKFDQISSVVSLISGAFTAVLVFLSLFDSELFLGVEITPGRNALFYLTVSGAIYAATRNNSPQPSNVPGPAYYMQKLIEMTRYEPVHWQNRWHTEQVQREFSALYQPRIMIFLEEVCSMVITPFLLLTKLPKCSDRIVDFFREFTIHVDGLGHVCSFAVFDFKKGGDNAPANRAVHGNSDPRSDYYSTNQNKMMASYYGFLDSYGIQGRGHPNSRIPGRAGFHPPPAFPTAFAPMSPVRGAQATGRDHVRQAVARRTPHLGPTAGRASPMQSVTLDPHHQPSMSTLRSSPRQGPYNGRYRSNLQTVSDPTDEAPARGRQKQPLVDEEDSMIGESWKASRLAEDDDEEENNTQGQGRGGGVLQLLQQFSKAQTDIKGPGAGI